MKLARHEKIIELIKEYDIDTQEELAGIIGVSRQAISKWESGMANPDIEKLIKLSELYGCSIDYIVGNDNKIDENGTNDELNKNIDKRIIRKIIMTILIREKRK